MHTCISLNGEKTLISRIPSTILKMLLHEEIVDVRFLDKFAVDPKYCLPFVDLFT